LLRELLPRLDALPGLVVARGTGDSLEVGFHPPDPGACRHAATSHAVRCVAQITGDSGLTVHLPGLVAGQLQELGWVSAVSTITPQATGIHGPRNAAEREVIWRIFLCAYEFAAASPGVAARPGRVDLAGPAAGR